MILCVSPLRCNAPALTSCRLKSGCSRKADSRSPAAKVIQTKSYSPVFSIKKPESRDDRNEPERITVFTKPIALPVACCDVSSKTIERSGPTLMKEPHRAKMITVIISGKKCGASKKANSPVAAEMMDPTALSHT